jgi:hypothetical protein
LSHSTKRILTTRASLTGGPGRPLFAAAKACSAVGASAGLEGVLERSSIVSTPMNVILCEALGELFEVRDIALGKDDRREARTLAASTSP